MQKIFDKVCVECGQPFQTTCSTKLMCSEKCREQRLKKQYRSHAIKRKEERRKNSPVRICKVCGKEFQIPGRLTCSKECTQKRKLYLYTAERKKPKCKAQKRLSRSPALTIHEILRELKAYNAAHPDGQLTYGKYVHLRDNGLLDAKK